MAASALPAMLSLLLLLLQLPTHFECLLWLAAHVAGDDGCVECAHLRLQVLQPHLHTDRQNPRWRSVQHTVTVKVGGGNLFLSTPEPLHTR